MELNIIRPNTTCSYLTLKIIGNNQSVRLEEIRNCTKCKKSLSSDNFRKKTNGAFGGYTKQCVKCLDSHKCEHGKQKNKCKICVGSAFCEHNVIKSSCKRCAGGSVCHHNKVRSRCRECGGGSYCDHNKLRIQCGECHGSSMCEHLRQRYHCFECQGKGICIHNKRKYQCRDCRGAAFCQHDKYKAYCSECGGSGLCLHNKRRYKCKLCGGGGICSHNKERGKCAICDPIGHLKSIISHRVWSALKNNKINKTVEYLGCDIETYKIYIESKFTAGMRWDNYGDWEIDHIIPIKYDNPSLEEVITRLHWTNTQPMWQHENASKGNRYISNVTIDRGVSNI